MSQDFQPRDPDFRRRTSDIFDGATFMRHLGARLEEIAPGECWTSLAVGGMHLQQDGFVHAGVQAALADHTAGCAAATLMAADQNVLTVEFKINLLRPASGETLECKAVVLRAGSSLTVAESELHALRRGERRLVSKATVTLAFIDAGRKPGR
ncbi:MAG: PaaI family thioesterase [Pseudomonadota bacterium]|nr:PaaI family thioesterase [Pseudomonadota bacterium]